MDSHRIKNWKIRLRLEQAIRHHFNQNDYLEVKTPNLVRSSGIDGHIKPIKTNGAFLPTSPELAMKKLLANGSGPIFQICPAFRDEPVSNLHLPEFTMLEWYQPHSEYLKLMNEVESLFETILKVFERDHEILYQGRKISFKQPWPRLKVRELFKAHTDLDLNFENEIPDSRCYEQLLAYCKKNHNINSDLTEYTWDDLFHLIWLNDIEPDLPKDRPVFVQDYPPWQRSLSRIGTDETEKYAKRFEIFIGGLELGNAFDESLDAEDYKRQFEHESNRSPHELNHPFDEELFDALKNDIPPTAGIAIGVDRIVMLLCDTTDIRSTVLLEPYWNY